ncbi:MAG: hypothetical protein HDR00_15735 [Lachnospiraceae bacterium]|nr:hypothetical protein [Lachnospiraceae bacterium]
MSSVFYRFLWAFPLSVIISILMTRLMEKSNHKKMMGCLLVIISNLLLNNIGFDISAWRMSDNLYMLDEEILQIGDMIEEDSEEENIVVLGEVDFMMQIRQYSSRICWGYDTRHYMIHAAPRIDVNASYRIAAAIQKHHCPDDVDIMSDLDELNADYIVIYQDSPFVNYLPEGNYEIIGETSKYKVIKMNYNTRYQEPVFTEKPLSDAHIETESVQVNIPA